LFACKARGGDFRTGSEEGTGGFPALEGVVLKGRSKSKVVDGFRKYAVVPRQTLKGMGSIRQFHVQML
jgi:hypothetical protein